VLGGQPDELVTFSSSWRTAVLRRQSTTYLGVPPQFSKFACRGRAPHTPLLHLPVQKRMPAKESTGAGRSSGQSPSPPKPAVTFCVFRRLL